MCLVYCQRFLDTQKIIKHIVTFLIYYQSSPDFYIAMCDYLFIQNLYSALFTNKRALMRYSIIKSITKSYYSESKNMYE